MPNASMPAGVAPSVRRFARTAAAPVRERRGVACLGSDRGPAARRNRAGTASSRRGCRRPADLEISG